MNWNDLKTLTVEEYRRYSQNLLSQLAATPFFAIHVGELYIPYINLDKELQAPSHTVEAYTLYTHSERVLYQCFEQWAFYDISSRIDFESYALLLAAHDIGKNLAVEYAGEKVHQHRFTVPILCHLLTRYDKTHLIPLFAALINMDPLGQFLKGHIAYEELVATISKACHLAKANPEDFYALLFFYYLCDASSYDSLKKRIFFYEDSGKLVIHPQHVRLNELNRLAQVFYA